MSTSIDSDASLREVHQEMSARYSQGPPSISSESTGLRGMKGRLHRASSARQPQQHVPPQHPPFSTFVPELGQHIHRTTQPTPPPAPVPTSYRMDAGPPPPLPIYATSFTMPQHFYAPPAPPPMPYGGMPTPPQHLHTLPAIPYGMNYGPPHHFYAPPYSSSQHTMVPPSRHLPQETPAVVPNPNISRTLPAPDLISRHSSSIVTGCLDFIHPDSPAASSRRPLASIAPNASAPRRTATPQSKASAKPVSQARRSSQVRFAKTTEVRYLSELPAPYTNTPLRPELRDAVGCSLDPERWVKYQERVLKLLLRPESKHQYITTRKLGEWWKAAEQLYQARYREGRRELRKSICGGHAGKGSFTKGWIRLFREEWLESDEGCILYRDNRRVPFLQKLYLEWIEMERDREHFQNANKQEREAMLQAGQHVISGRSTRKRSFLHENEVSEGDTDVSDDEHERRASAASSDLSEKTHQRVYQVRRSASVDSTSSQTSISGDSSTKSNASMAGTRSSLNRPRRSSGAAPAARLIITEWTDVKKEHCMQLLLDLRFDLEEFDGTDGYWYHWWQNADRTYSSKFNEKPLEPLQRLVCGGTDAGGQEHQDHIGWIAEFEARHDEHPHERLTPLQSTYRRWITLEKWRKAHGRLLDSPEWQAEMKALNEGRVSDEKDDSRKRVNYCRGSGATGPSDDDGEGDSGSDVAVVGSRRMSPEPTSGPPAKRARVD